VPPPTLLIVLAPNFALPRYLTAASADTTTEMLQYMYCSKGSPEPLLVAVDECGVSPQREVGVARSFIYAEQVAAAEGEARLTLRDLLRIPVVRARTKLAPAATAMVLAIGITVVAGTTDAAAQTCPPSYATTSINPNCLRVTAQDAARVRPYTVPPTTYNWQTERAIARGVVCVAGNVVSAYGSRGRVRLGGGLASSVSC
jgi:hypothetical protein